MKPFPFQPYLDENIQIYMTFYISKNYTNINPKLIWKIALQVHNFIKVQ